MTLKTHDLFLSLVRLGIGHTDSTKFTDKVDWAKLKTLADQHGLSAVVVDGVEKLPEGQRPPQPVLLQWIGETLQGYEYRYELYRKTISEMAAFYNNHGFKMMVLKGYVCSLDWPNPKHRPCGDIDIWLFGKCHEADEVLAKEKRIKSDTSHHHHTVFYWNGFMVENHYDFINVYRNKINHKQEKLLKKLGEEDSHFVAVDGERIYVPSANLQAFFLLRHSMGHFATSEITMRQLIDWAFFLEKHGKEVDWNWLLGVLDEYHMKEFFNCINAICVEELGFDSRIFPNVQFNPILKERVANDILKPEFNGEEPKHLLPRVFFKFKRWKANEWKHKLCYEESMWSSFWNGVWNHILKPSSL